jgi:uncharacterized membrane protein
MNLETSKALGGIGAILLFIGVIPFLEFLWVVGIVGVILVLIALHGLADYYRERGIFNNALYGLIAGIIGILLSAVVAVVIVLQNIRDLASQLFPGWDGDWRSLQGMTPDTANIDPADFLPLLMGLLSVFVVAWIFSIISAFFVRRSLKLTAVRTDVSLFSTAGLLLLVGAVLIIAFGVGAILMWVAVLLLAIAFFTIKPIPQSIPPQPATTINSSTY